MVFDLGKGDDFCSCVENFKWILMLLGKIIFIVICWKLYFFLIVCNKLVFLS